MSLMNVGDYSDKIEIGHPNCCCPFCDDEITEFDSTYVITAHGSKYLVHADCLEPE